MNLIVGLRDRAASCRQWRYTPEDSILMFPRISVDGLVTSSPASFLERGIPPQRLNILIRVSSFGFYALRSGCACIVFLRKTAHAALVPGVAAEADFGRR